MNPRSASLVLIELDAIELSAWFDALVAIAEGVVKVNVWAMRRGATLPRPAFVERDFCQVGDQYAWPIRTIMAIDKEANCLELAALLTAKLRIEGDPKARVIIITAPGRTDGHAVVMTGSGRTIEAREVLTS